MNKTFSRDTELGFHTSYAVTYLWKVMPKFFVAGFEITALCTRGKAFLYGTFPDRTTLAGRSLTSLILTAVAVEIFELEVRLFSIAPFLGNFLFRLVVVVECSLIQGARVTVYATVGNTAVIYVTISCGFRFETAFAAAAG